MQAGAGEAIKLADAAYQDVEIIADRRALVAAADVVLGVQPPAPEVIDAMKEGAVLICFIYENKEPALVQRMLDRKITCFAMETVPRISRAQAMDALSSQSALAGYYAVQVGSTHMPRILPKITSAAGAIGPAKVLVMGLGVAGLEAVATAHRLGAVVEGYDVRPDTKGQVESLGAKFVDTGVDATGAGGYARELTDAEKAKVAAVLTEHIQQSDLIITTAAIPGGRDEGGRGDRRPVRRGRRELRRHQSRRNDPDRPCHHRCPPERTLPARSRRERTIFKERL
jgi:NAD(P) transhydrogenase subunit alpha